MGILDNQPQQQMYGLGGVAPAQTNPMGNPYQAMPSPYSQFGANGGGQGGPIPLGQPSQNGLTLAQLSAPNSSMTVAQKQALAKGLLSAVNQGSPNAGAVAPTSIPPGILQG